MLDIRNRLHDSDKSNIYEQKILSPVFVIDDNSKRGFPRLFIFVHEFLLTDSSDQRNKIFSALGLANRYFPATIKDYVEPGLRPYG
jgi:hypothetical protein